MFSLSASMSKGSGLLSFALDAAGHVKDYKYNS